MTKDEAREIITLCKDWNKGQRGFTAEENAVYEARRRALKKAWDTLAEIEGGDNDKAE